MRIRSWRLGTRPSVTRIPFRYGTACLTECPQAMLEITVEFSNAVVRGYAADCFPPLWFDKSPERTFTQQIEDMIEVIAQSANNAVVAGELNGVGELATLQWEDGGIDTRPPLLNNFGHSMVERAVIDALCRNAKTSFREFLCSGKLYNEFSVVLDAWGVLKTMRPWRQDHSNDRIAVRHTVGLSDPLTAGDGVALSSDECVDLPVSLEDHLRVNGIRYLKIKIGNRGKADIERLQEIMKVVTSAGNAGMKFTLDGNEQYSSISEFTEFWEELKSLGELKQLTQNVLAIEQPLRRNIALNDSATLGLRRLSREVPVIIDESDSGRDECWKAICVGYSGTSSKACKGVTKSLLNRQLIEEMQQANEDREYLMTGEDLCCVGVVPLQTDLALASVLGLSHVERNGHHYHAGLSYLPEEMYGDILVSHGDLYRNVNGVPALRIDHGMLNLTSVNEGGFGFRINPRFDTYHSVREG